MTILIPHYRTARRKSGGLLLTDLVAHWDLSEASGQRNDSHTNALHLTDNNTVGSGTGVDGVSTCASFDHTASEYLSRADNVLLDPEDQHFTVNFWVRRTNGSSTYPGYIGKGNSGTSGGGWNITPSNPALNSQICYAGARLANNSNRALITPAATENASTWYMYTFSHDPDANLIRLYRDGSSLGTAGITGGVYDTTEALHIGRLSTGYLTGKIQSVSIWKGAGALTVLSHLSWLYNSGSAARLYADLQSYGG